MLVRLLGQVAVGPDEGSMRPIVGQVPSLLLAQLAAAAGRLVTLDGLIDGLWTEPPMSARNSVQVAVSKLRKQIGADLIQGTRVGYALRAGLLRIDLSEARMHEAEARTAARSGRWIAAEAAAREAVQLFVGDPLAGLSGPVVARLRVGAEQLWSAVRLLHAECLIEVGDLRQADDVLGDHLESNPLDESACILHMRCLASLGRGAEALVAFDLLRHRLSDELGTSPAHETEAVFTGILQGDLQVVRPSRSLPVRGRFAEARVPLDRAPLIGRDADLDQLVGVVESGHRLVTLVGAGGIGKTRLAAALAHRLTQQSGRPAAFLDLSTLVRPEDLGSLAERALDPESVGLSVSLESTAAIVLVDNAEHVLDAAAELVQVLLAVEGVTVVVTTRVLLELRDEYAFYVTPLSCDGARSAAVELMVGQSAAMGLADVDAASLIDLARQAGGMPLALELLASGLRWHSPAELLDQVRDRSEWVGETHPARDRPTRHQSIFGAIAWSLDQLDPDTVYGLGQLTVFIGRFNEKAAAAILTAADPNVPFRSVLGRLIDASLIQRVRSPGDITFQILEPIRRAVRGHAAGSEPSDVTRRAHANYFLEWARRVDLASLDTLRNLEELRLLDRGNVVAAVEWGWAADPARTSASLPAVLVYWNMQDADALVATWAARALDSEVLAERDRLRVLIVQLLTLVHTRTIDAAELGRRVLENEEQAAELEPRWTTRWIQLKIGLARLNGDTDMADRLAAGAVPDGRRIRLVFGMHKAYTSVVAGDYERAEHLAGEMARLAELAEEKRTQVIARNIQGVAQIYLGRLGEAETTLDEVRLLAIHLERPVVLLACVTNFGWLRVAQERCDDALRELRQLETKYMSDDLYSILDALIPAGLALMDSAGMRMPHRLRCTQRGWPPRRPVPSTSIPAPNSRGSC